MVGISGVLSEIRIRGLGVIADATLDPSPGFTVITGETGAGKTMVVAGLGLLLGAKADAARVRPESGRAIVEGRFLLPSDDLSTEMKVLNLALDDVDAERDEDGSVIVSRTVHAEGRSRSTVGGRGVPVGMLSSLGEQLVTVHGQSQQFRLLRPAQQRSALDRYAGAEVLDLVERHRQIYQRWRDLSAEIEKWASLVAERAAEARSLTAGLAEIEKADPKPGEDAELKETSKRLEHAEALRVAAFTAHQALVGDPTSPSETMADAAALVGVVRNELSDALRFDDSLQSYVNRAEELAALTADLAAELASYAESLDADPARLATIHDRRAVLNHLVRAYAPDGDVDGVLAWAERGAARLAELDSDETKLPRLQTERDAALAELTDLALKLSAARRAAAVRFGAEVSEELTGLAMPHAIVSAEVRRQPAADGAPGLELDDERIAVGPEGIDEVELLLRPHPGAPPLPLHRGASGGELSRVMLAVEVVLAGVSAPGAMVFDEVDAGVGGKAAVEVGRRLARLARNHQVLVVTHLPQVAAFADRHVVVVKDADGSVTTSGLRALTAEERPKELARMLAGMDESEVGIAHAEELLALARNS